MNYSRKKRVSIMVTPLENRNKVWEDNDNRFIC